MLGLSKPRLRLNWPGLNRRRQRRCQMIKVNYKRQAFIRKKERIQNEQRSNIWCHPWDLVPNNHTTISLDETTPVENQSHITLSPGGTTVIQGKGKGLFNDSDENVRNPEITPEFLAQNRKQILLLLQKEEKEQKLKEVRSQLEFEDVSVEDMDEDDAETEMKQDKETSQPKIQGGRKETHEDGVKSRITKKLEFDDDYSKPYRPSTARQMRPQTITQP
ncbi:hypothetical protein E3N88_36937 [Mikania micrantha]|uniref:Uncharacterized protein n=1 Tax=Mikania micrantha TaxID=192012 RepID=A0A5N6M5B5_9ASTR|nr:hypothetical protein E3N88_36937 [Mikania micrantha]